MPAPADLRLVVLFGGRSAEHDVSCVTARHVCNALDAQRYQIEPIGITRDGTWVRADPATPASANTDGPAALSATGNPVNPFDVLGSAAARQTVVLPLLHGPFGEDGTIQGLLELADVPYVGSGVLASAVAMDKSAAKDLAAAHGLAQPKWRSVQAELWSNDDAAALQAELGLPLFVKPANMGSSIGVTRVTALSELADAVAVASRYDAVVIIEEAIQPAREIEVAVLGNHKPRASIPGEIRPGAAFYDFADKYEEGSAELLIPAALSTEESERIRELAVIAFKAMRAEGLARVDFLYEEGGRGALLNEVNTMPGFTPISMFPKLWEASGMPYGVLLDELVALALERHARRARHRSTEH